MKPLTWGRIDTPLTDRLRADPPLAHDDVRFLGESSHTGLLHTWTPEPLDVVLIDGAHSFPFPTLDWMYTAPHLKVGGRMLVGDAYPPPGNVLSRYMTAKPAWGVET